MCRISNKALWFVSDIHKTFILDRALQYPRQWSIAYIRDVSELKVKRGESEEELISSAQITRASVGRLDSSIILEEGQHLVLIDGLEIRDPELFEIISDQQESARPEFVKTALKVGAVALRDAITTGKIDLVERKFQGLCTELDKILREKLGREGMKGELDRIFGKNGELQICLESIFGEKGKLVRDILDMENRKSPIGRLREKIESYVVGKDSEVYGMLDPNREDSPIHRLRQEIMGELTSLKSTIEGQIARKEVIERTTQKGFEFEDMLEEFLQRVSNHFNDIVERVGQEKGKLGNKKGDFLITVSDPISEGSQPKIVIEAKSGKSVRLTQKGLLGELDQAMKNREARFAIAVTESQISEPIGNYREVPPDKIVCTFGEDGLPVEVAYKVARTRLLLDVYQESEKEIDVGRINGIVSKIGSDLNTIRGIKAKLTSIGNTSEAIKSDLRALEKSIRESLNELQDCLS